MPSHVAPRHSLGGLAIAAVVIACATSVPTPSASLAPTTTPSTVPSPFTSTPTHQLTPAPTRFTDSGLAFDYPFNWRLIADEVFDGVNLLWAVGTGEWDDGSSSVDPGEIVMEFSFQMHGPYVPVFESPPFDAVALPSGAVASLVGSDGGALIYAADREMLRVRVSVGGPPSAATQSLIRAVIDSISFGGGLPGAPGETWDPATVAPGSCARTTLVGRLNRGHSPTLGLLEPDHGFATLIWPDGWSTRDSDHARMEVIDAEGNVVARQWDAVEMGGRVDRNSNNLFRVCPDSLSVTQSFSPR